MAIIWHFPSPRLVRFWWNLGSLGSGKIVSLEGRPLLKRMECSGLSPKCLLFPSPWLKRERIFLWSSPWEHGRAPGGITHENVGTHIRLGPQFFTLKAPPVSSNVSYPLSVPNRLQHWLLLLVAAIQHICLFLQFWGWQFALWPQFSNGTKKRYWFSVCSGFFLLWMWEW